MREHYGEMKKGIPVTLSENICNRNDGAILWKQSAKYNVA
jgi:hypothetical protein